jgi:hypothetical protein
MGSFHPGMSYVPAKSTARITGLHRHECGRGMPSWHGRIARTVDMCLLCSGNMMEGDWSLRTLSRLSGSSSCWPAKRGSSVELYFGTEGTVQPSEDESAKRFHSVCISGHSDYSFVGATVRRQGRQFGCICGTWRGDKDPEHRSDHAKITPEMSRRINDLSGQECPQCH